MPKQPDFLVLIADWAMTKHPLWPFLDHLARYDLSQSQIEPRQRRRAPSGELFRIERVVGKRALMQSLEEPRERGWIQVSEIAEHWGLL